VPGESTYSSGLPLPSKVPKTAKPGLSTSVVSVPSGTKLLFKPTLSTGSIENVANVRTPYLIRECPADTPGRSDVKTGMTSVSLSKSAESVSPNRSLMSSTSTTC